jgi:hypothetical protein
LKLKQTSPELPLLQAVGELNASNQQGFELLPTASVDLLPSVDPAIHLADVKDADSQGSQDNENSTCLAESECSDASANKCQWSSHALEQACGSVHDRCPTSILDTAGATAVDISSLTPFTTVATDVSELCMGTVQQLLCTVHRDLQHGGMLVVPCLGDDVHTDAEYEVFWCFAQPRDDGAIVLSPCTSHDACGITVDAGGEVLAAPEAPGAPERPSAASYAPSWVYGPQWPFCAAPTTLMLHNLPTEFLQEDLIEVLDKEGFGGFYDFVYLPMESGFGRNIGHAIVNLTRHEYGLALAAKLQGRTAWFGFHGIQCQVTWSVHSQGISQLIEHYRDHPGNHDSVPTEMRPSFFSKGFPAPFPAGAAE